MLTREDFRNKYQYCQATPMLQQYLDIKFLHQYCILLFRVGDFYELFFDDAITVSKLLGLALAKKGKHAGQDLPMCGIPHHALESYLPRLVEQEYKVALCEQLESPEEAKKRDGYKAVVKRDVVRIITAGTITEENLIKANAPNYLAAIVIHKDTASICYCDVSTVEFIVIDVAIHHLTSELSRINPKEIILSESIQHNSSLLALFDNYKQKIVYQVESYFSFNKAQRIIQNYYEIITIDSIGSLNNAQVSTVGAILEYLNIIQKHSKSKLPFPQIVSHENFMLIDASARKNLELTSALNGNFKGSLLSVIDATVTNQGGRLLYKFLSTPLANVNSINSRLQVTDFFYQNLQLVENLRQIIKSAPDIERALSRILIAKALPKDLECIKISLKLALNIKEELAKVLDQNIPKYLEKIYNPLFGDNELYNLLDSALLTDLPNSTNDGGFIKSSYNAKLAELRHLVHNSSNFIEQLKLQYRQETLVDTLKICRNNVLGLFIEVSSKNAHKITDHKFIYKQTTTTAVRFTTNELQNLEAEMLNANGMIIALEQEILVELCKAISLKSKKLNNLAKSISLIDVFCNFAYISHEYNYCRPEITNDLAFNIVAGRHSVIEKLITKKHENFINNDCNLQNNQRIWLITGPNMAGKSTFLRQNAIIVILAQIGCYVPAQSAQIGVVDKLFSRIGAADDLASGQSTFMVEMVETSVILAQSTFRSLVILDEIGRGTSTYDGISIAWSCLEYIHNNISCRCLFATHYHELVDLASKLPSLKNFTVKIHDSDGKLSFLYKIIEGAANKSYGIHVAELAGLPQIVLKRAKEILLELEHNKADISQFKSDTIQNNTTLPPAYPIKTIEIIKQLNPDQLTPKEALNMIYKIKNIASLEETTC
ncbi:DNA mismatch repair protein MutS [Orientia chuto str. Dubai]|uniref:DNA mismatch repair protein MutS n=1 Tax=Orientia chuto str. Dubai TaxID=1359168 RepID=A0A0F3MN02_9RICK|nr:DNA mismatch repair protein MutS [Candidatus Orientia mediorientalis]KJV57100.1 DNA mismatch repair protein MutS [Orientia chuto str. Dubai]